jgi:virginiamycin A acetyltransferase
MSLRAFAKSILRGLATLAVSPMLGIHAMKIPLLGRDRALEGSTQALALVPGLCGQYLRQAFLTWTIAECHPTASIGFGTIFSKCNASIGANVYIGPYCSFGDVTIGRDCLIATGVHVTSGSKMHGIADLTRPIREQPGEWVTVTIGQNCWIGNGAIVMADIGRDSVVGAGSVVTKPVPAGVIAVGNPARVIRNR